MNDKIQYQNYKIFLAANILVAIVGGLITSLSLIYLLDRLDGGSKEIAFLTLIIAIPQAIIAYFSGHTSDLWGRKKLLILAEMLLLIAVVGYIFADDYSFIYVYSLQILISIAGIMYGNAERALLADLTDNDCKRGKKMGIYDAVEIFVAAAALFISVHFSQVMPTIVIAIFLLIVSMIFLIKIVE